MDFGLVQDEGQERVRVCNTDLIRFLSSPPEFSTYLKDKFEIWKRKVAEKTRAEMGEIKRAEMVKLEKITEMNWIPLYLFGYNLELEVLISLIEFAGIEAFARANDVPVCEIIDIVSRYRTVHGSRLERLKKMQEATSSSSGHQDQQEVDDGEEVLGSNENNGLQQIDDGDDDDEGERVIKVLKENPNGDELEVLETKDESSENIKINRQEKQVDSHGEDKLTDEIVKEKPSGEDDKHNNEKQEAITVENLQQVDEDEEGERVEDITEVLKENPNGDGLDEKEVLETKDEEHKTSENIKINCQEKQVDGHGADEIVKENPSGEDDVGTNEKQEAITVENLQQEVDGGGEDDKERQLTIKEKQSGKDEQKVQGSRAQNRQEKQVVVDEDERKKEEERWRQSKDF